MILHIFLALAVSVFILNPLAQTQASKVVSSSAVSDPNLSLNAETALAGEHQMYTHAIPGRDAGLLRISQNDTELSISFLYIEFLNANRTLGFLPVMNILAEAQSTDMFYIDAIIDYSRAHNLISINGVPISQRLKTRIYLFNTGEQIYLAWTIYNKAGQVIFDESFHSHTVKKSSCFMQKGKIICK